MSHLKCLSLHVGYWLFLISPTVLGHLEIGTVSAPLVIVLLVTAPLASHRPAIGHVTVIGGVARLSVTRTA